MSRIYEIFVPFALSALAACAQTVAHSNGPSTPGTTDPGAPTSSSSLGNQKATIYKSLVPPKLASDMFGRRISRNYIVFQVTVVNESKDLDLLIHNIGVRYGDLIPINCTATSKQVTTKTEPEKVDKTSTPGKVSKNDNLEDWKKQLLGMTTQIYKKRGGDSSEKQTKPEKTYGLEAGHIAQSMEACESSSHEISILRGVAEKGQIQDPRNVTYRLLQGIATLGGGLTGVAGLGPVLPLAVSAFAGPGIAAFQTMFPDFTINQMNRLNDTAFAANTLVTKDRSKIVSIFIPMRDFLNEIDAATFIDHPYDFYVGAGGKTALGLLDIVVDYKHVIAVDDIDPIISDVQMTPTEQAKLIAGQPARGQIVGRFLDGAEVSLAGGDPKTPKVERDTSQSSTDTRLFFKMTPNGATNPKTPFPFELSKSKKTTSFTKVFDVAPLPPSLSSISPASGSQDSDIEVTFTGANLYDFDFKVEAEDPPGAKGEITSKSAVITPTSVKAMLHISADATVSNSWRLRLSVAGAKTGSVLFEVTAK